MKSLPFKEFKKTLGSFKGVDAIHLDSGSVSLYDKNGRWLGHIYQSGTVERRDPIQGLVDDCLSDLDKDNGIQ